MTMVGLVLRYKDHIWFGYMGQVLYVGGGGMLGE